MLKKLLELIKTKSFLLGFALAVGMFSHYIFGPDNLAEQMSESIFKQITGQTIDFTPEN